MFAKTPHFHDYFVKQSLLREKLSWLATCNSAKLHEHVLPYARRCLRVPLVLFFFCNLTLPEVVFVTDFFLHNHEISFIILK